MQVRGFAPIGMLECWNIGIMVFRILKCVQVFVFLKDCPALENR
jgi:hypothetical protein